MEDLVGAQSVRLIGAIMHVITGRFHLKDGKTWCKQKD